MEAAADIKASIWRRFASTKGSGRASLAFFRKPRNFIIGLFQLPFPIMLPLYRRPDGSVNDRGRRMSPELRLSLYWVFLTEFAEEDIFPKSLALNLSFP